MDREDHQYTHLPCHAPCTVCKKLWFDHFHTGPYVQYDVGGLRQGAKPCSGQAATDETFGAPDAEEKYLQERVGAAAGGCFAIMWCREAAVLFIVVVNAARPFQSP